LSRLFDLVVFAYFFSTYVWTFDSVLIIRWSYNKR